LRKEAESAEEELGVKTRMNTYNVRYLGGVTIKPEKAKGTLTLEERQLEFKSEKTSFTIPLESIVDVNTQSKTDKTYALAAGLIGLIMVFLLGGLIGLIAGFLAGGVTCLIVFALARKNKEDQIGVLAISFKDAVDDLQHPEFAFMPVVRQAVESKSIDLVKEATKQLYELRLKAKGSA